MKCNSDLVNSNEQVIFKDEGIQSNKNINWFISKDLIVDVNEKGTNLKMPHVGMFNYSPNILISGDFDLSVDINMPKGAFFLSFGFNTIQNIFSNFDGWWNSDNFQRLKITRRSGFIKYYLNEELKCYFDLEDDDLYFQFRIYSMKDTFEFSFKNFLIISVDCSDEEYYNNKIENLNFKYNSLNSELNKKIDALEKKYEARLDSYHHYFSTLFLDYNLEHKGLLKNTHTLCQELLNLIDNICRKYDLKYWLDYGNLLGAVRHEGFIPWDDDMDIGMMREDYIKLLEVLPSELEKNNLNDFEISISNYIKSNKKNIINTFTQILLLDEGLIFAGLDIFPYDFLDDYPDNFSELYLEERNNHYIPIIEGVSRSEVFEKIYSNLNLTYSESNYVVCGVEHGLFYNRELILDKDKIFPLKSIIFEEKVYPAPNDCDFYLNSIYGDYQSIPKLVHHHTRQEYLRKREDTPIKYDFYIKKFKEINRWFK